MSVVESMPVCVTIADVTLPGLPLVYVNREFCRVTGYSKSEAQGRNCRFLQGPDTGVRPVFAISASIRSGQDCFVRLANYTKSGVALDTLLCLRMFHDSTGAHHPHPPIRRDHDMIDKWYDRYVYRK